MYKDAKLKMATLMLPVKKFLDDLKKEKERSDDESGSLKTLIEESGVAERDAVSTRRVFRPPSIPKPSVYPVMQKIRYEEPLDKVDRAKRKLRAKSFKEVGEKTFEYFYQAEVDDE